MLSSTIATRPLASSTLVTDVFRQQLGWGVARTLSTSSSAGPSRLRGSSLPTLASTRLSRPRQAPFNAQYRPSRIRQMSTLPYTPIASAPLEPADSMAISTDPNAAIYGGLVDAVPDPSFLDPLIHPLADILLSFPHPLGYGTSIILLTILVRTAITLPVTLWQKERAMRAKRLVEPEMRIINERLAMEIMADSRKRGYSYTQYVAELRRQLANAQSALHKKHRTHPFITTWAPLGVHLPIFITLSLVIRRALEMPDSPLAADSFLWLDKLGEVDGQWILPIAGMAVAFGNAEMVGNVTKQVREAFRPSTGEVPAAETGQATTSAGSAKAQSRPAAAPVKPITTAKQARSPQHPKPDAPSTGLFAGRSSAHTAPSSSPHTSSTLASTASHPPRPRKMSTTATPLLAAKSPGNLSQASSTAKSQSPLVDVGVKDKQPSFSPARQAELRRGFFAMMLRFSALGFGMIASQMPSGLVLYWFTSLFYSFAQNTILTWLPRWRKAQAGTTPTDAA